MRKIVKSRGPFIKDNLKTDDIMRILFFSLIPVILFAIYKNGIMPYSFGYGTVFDMLKPIIMILSAVLTCFATEFIWARFILKEKKKSLGFYLKNSHFAFPGIFLALVLPINTPIILIIAGAFIATFIGKILFGGFGSNIFNPALIGVLFVTSSYYGLIALRGGYFNVMEVDIISSATPLTNLGLNNYIADYSTLVTPFGDLFNFFGGFTPGSLGETSSIFIIIGFLYLVCRKAINWYIPVMYVGTVFILTAGIGLYFGLGIWYPVFHILSGGLLFGAVYMATDPVTSPSNPVSQILYGVALGILTVIFRYSAAFPEGVLTAILTMNMLVVIFDKIGSRGRVDNKKLIIPIVILILFFGLVFYSIINKLDKKDEEVIDETFDVMKKTVNDSEYVYYVSQDGYHGLIHAVIYIEDGVVIEINNITQSESVWALIEEEDYIEKLLDNQKNIENVDVVSGATYTSNYIKDMITKTLKYHGDNYEK